MASSDHSSPDADPDGEGGEESTTPAPHRDGDLWLLFAVTLVAVGNVSSVAPAFPRVVDVFGISRVEVGWVVTAYSLPGILTAPLAGVLADRLGRKRVLVPTLFVFGVALLVSLVKSLRAGRIRTGHFLTGLAVGVPNYFASHFLILSLSELRTAVVFPIYSAMTIVLISLAGWLGFGERLRVRERWAVALTVVALVLVNLQR